MVNLRLPFGADVVRHPVQIIIIFVSIFSSCSRKLHSLYLAYFGTFPIILTLPGFLNVEVVKECQYSFFALFPLSPRLQPCVLLSEFPFSRNCPSFSHRKTSFQQHCYSWHCLTAYYPHHMVFPTVGGWRLTCTSSSSREAALHVLLNCR